MESRKINTEDYFTIQLSAKNLEIAKHKSEAALTENELASLAYKYTILQIYHKYGLKDNETIDMKTGEIKVKEENNDSANQ